MLKIIHQEEMTFLLKLMLGWPVLSASSLFSSFFSNPFLKFKKDFCYQSFCAQMVPRSLHVLPFRLYCQPAYPPLMELLKSRYESNLGGPAFCQRARPPSDESTPIRIGATPAGRVTLCITICGYLTGGGGTTVMWRRGRARWKKKSVLVINMYKVFCFSFLANLNDQYCTALCLKQRDESRSCLFCLQIFAGS